jgi:hypothetical protein
MAGSPVRHGEAVVQAFAARRSSRRRGVRLARGCGGRCRGPQARVSSPSGYRGRKRSVRFWAAARRSVHRQRWPDRRVAAGRRCRSPGPCARQGRPALIRSSRSLADGCAQVQRRDHPARGRALKRACGLNRAAETLRTAEPSPVGEYEHARSPERLAVCLAGRAARFRGLCVVCDRGLTHPGRVRTVLGRATGAREKRDHPGESLSSPKTHTAIISPARAHPSTPTPSWRRRKPMRFARFCSRKALGNPTARPQPD